MLKTVFLLLVSMLTLPQAQAGKTVALADVGLAWSNQQQLNEVGARVGYHATLGPLFVGPEAGFHRFSGNGSNIDLIHVGVRGGLDVLTAVSVFIRMEGVTAEQPGMAYGLSYDFNKVPGLTAGVHASMMDMGESWMPTAGLHGGLRF